MTSRFIAPCLIPRSKGLFEWKKNKDKPETRCNYWVFRFVLIITYGHSFASLAYHLQMPEKIAMEIGGWADATTMHQIYTHIAKSDIKRYQTAMMQFYSSEVAADGGAGELGR